MSRIRKLIEACKSAQVITDRAEVVATITRLATEGRGPSVRQAPDGRSYFSRDLAPPTKAKAIEPGDVDTWKAAAIAAGVEWEDAAFLDTTPEGLRARVLAFWASDERVDRSGDITLQEWELDAYRKAPHILVGHDWYTQTRPVASAIINEVRDRKDDDYDGPGLYQVNLYPARAISELAGEVYDLARLRLFNTVSVGYFPRIITYIADQAEREQYGPGFGGYLFGPNELVEVSHVNVPANAGAVQDQALALMARAASAGEIGPGHIALYRAAIRGEQWAKAMDARLMALQSALFPDEKAANNPTDNINDRVEALEKAVGSSREAIDRLVKVVEAGIPAMATRLGVVESTVSGHAKIVAAQSAEQERQAQQDAALILGTLPVDSGTGGSNDAVKAEGASPDPVKAPEGQAQDGSDTYLAVLAAACV